MILEGRCALPHDGPDAAGDFVPLKSCPLCKGTGRVRIEVTRADGEVVDPPRMGYSVEGRVAPKPNEGES